MTTKDSVALSPTPIMSNKPSKEPSMSKYSLSQPLSDTRTSYAALTHTHTVSIETEMEMEMGMGMGMELGMEMAMGDGDGDGEYE